MNPLSIRLKKIILNDDELVHVDYLKCKCNSEVYSQAQGDCILVKDQLSEDDVDWIRSYPQNVNVFTMQAGTYTAFECSEQLSKIGHSVNYLNDVGLNFFHFGQTLFVFCECHQEDADVASPNVIKIYPVKKSEVAVPYVIQEHVNTESMTPKESLKSTDITATEKAIQEKENSNQIAELKIKDYNAQKSKLLRQQIKEQFDQMFSFVKVQFKGTSIGRTSVPLSEFYKYNVISEGRLKGSWTLFKPEEVEQIMDKSILVEALDSATKQYVIKIPKYGQIVRVKDLENYFKTVKNIETDFKSYLSGNSEKSCIGGVKIKKKFSPYDILDKGMDQLKDYLIDLLPQAKKKTTYLETVEAFIEYQHDNFSDFSSRVELRIDEIKYGDSKWEDPEFVLVLWRVLEHKKDVLTEDPKLFELLGKYLDCLYQTNTE